MFAVLCVEIHIIFYMREIEQIDRYMKCTHIYSKSHAIFAQFTVVNGVIK